MKITVLGAGGAFAPMSRGNSAFLVEHADRRILIDCGATVPYVLRDEMGIPLQSITDVVVTHCHADHIGGLEHLLYACRYMPETQGKPDIYATDRVMNELIAALRPGMGWAQDGSALSVDEAFFVPCRNDQEIAGLPLEFCDVTHVGNMPATAVRLGKLMVSGDTKEPVDPTQVFGHDAVELIFHEAEVGYSSDAHTKLKDLRNHLPEYLWKRTWLYHHPDPDTLHVDDVAELEAEFAGFLRKGQIFEL